MGVRKGVRVPHSYYLAPKLHSVLPAGSSLSLSPAPLDLRLPAACWALWEGVAQMPAQAATLLPKFSSFLLPGKTYRSAPALSV